MGWILNSRCTFCCQFWEKNTCLLFVAAKYLAQELSHGYALSYKCRGNQIRRSAGPGDAGCAADERAGRRRARVLGYCTNLMAKLMPAAKLAAATARCATTVTGSESLAAESRPAAPTSESNSHELWVEVPAKPQPCLWQAVVTWLPDRCPPRHRRRLSRSQC